MPKNNRNGSSKNPSQRRKRSNGKASAVVRGASALGTHKTGPLQLKTEQFATFTPLQTFSIVGGSTPGGIRVRGRELLGAIKSGATGAPFGANNVDGVAAVIALNPGSFPRLTAYGPIYEMYKFHRAKVMFQSSQPTTAGGVAELAVDYDSGDAAASAGGSTVAMMRQISSCISNVYADCALEVSGNLSRLPRYYCASSASDTTDVNQANILYAFEGVSAGNTTQGYLVVEYDVEFFTPQ